MSKFTLLDLEEIIARRAGESPKISYTANLTQSGINKAAEKRENLGPDCTEIV